MKPSRSMRLLLIFPMMILMTSCGGGDPCGWVKKIKPSIGDVFTRPTKEQIVAHNRKVDRFCR